MRSANTLPWRSAPQLYRSANSGAVLTSPVLCGLLLVRQRIVPCTTGICSNILGLSPDPRPLSAPPYPFVSAACDHSAPGLSLVSAPLTPTRPFTFRSLRQAFVGPIEVLGATLSIMCELAATSLQEQGLITPPWRTKPYLCKGYQSAIEYASPSRPLCSVRIAVLVLEGLRRGLLTSLTYPQCPLLNIVPIPVNCNLRLPF